MARYLTVGRFAEAVLVLMILAILPYGAQGTVNVLGGGAASAHPLFDYLGANYRYAQETVDVEYREVNTDTTLISFGYSGSLGDLDFLILELGLTEQELRGYGVTLLPLMGQPLVSAYNLPSLDAVNYTLVLDGPTLGAIWMGDILWWNDTAIADLNPGAPLPEERIQLAYASDYTATMSQLHARALRESYPPLNSLVYHNAIMWSRVPGIANHSVNLGLPSMAQPNYVKGKPYSLTYTTKRMADEAGVRSANMKTKTGAVVEPSVASVTSAMNEVASQLTSSWLGVDVINGNLSTSWPICMITYIVLASSTNVSDCTYIHSVLEFVAWSQLNPEVIARIPEFEFAPLPFGFKTKLIDLMGLITCNSDRAYGQTYLIGEGLQFNVYSAWMQEYASPDIRLRYFPSSDDAALNDLANHDVDFAGSSSTITSAKRQSDVVSIPVVAYAVGVAYNMPELKERGSSLVLSLDVLADIILGVVDNWNHTSIRGLNPLLAAYLPNAPINVINPIADPTAMLVFTKSLSAASPSFNTQVGEGTIVRFPVEALGRNINASDALTVLENTTHALTIALHERVRPMRQLGFADFINPAGNRVAPGFVSLNSAILDAASGYDLINGAGNASWPMAIYHQFLVHQTSMADCRKAQGLVDWIYWTQTGEAALSLALRNFLGVPGHASSSMRRRLIQFVAEMKCDNQTVSSYSGCIDGTTWTMCSDHGYCGPEGICVCDGGYQGQYCEIVTTSSSSDTTLAVILGIIIPVVVLALLAVCCALIGAAIWTRRAKREQDEWEVDIDELEIGEQLGTGGHGEVRKALWKGTEVAVKMMVLSSSSGAPVREMERNFKEEVRIMTALRHPNVVLFMGASTKPPKMCIIMEFMALGSLFELLSNELVASIPEGLRIKMAYQAAKGMHFLHSSGIVHRDLKSLNLLLDNKWNVKVSDFGLTKFKEELKRNGGNSAQIQGTVHWTAPEILNEDPDADLMLADVYSFGIILWELITRQQPYMGMSPATIAVAVIRDNLRPEMPEDDEVEGEATTIHVFKELISCCWHQDPTIRPSFLEIMNRLSSIGGVSGSLSFVKTSSSSSLPVSNASWNSPAGTTSSQSEGSASSGSPQSRTDPAAKTAERPPQGDMAIVFSDITRAASLWEFNAAAMRDATSMHNELLRQLLMKHKGYEVGFIRDRNSGEGSFCMAFQHTSDALEWCMAVQRELMQVDWPKALLEHPGACEEWDKDDNTIFRGLRVRMGVHYGQPRVVSDPMTRRIDFIGPVVNAAARITAITHGGQILLSDMAYARIKDSDLARESQRITCLGKFEMPDAPKGARLYELTTRGIEGRSFVGISSAQSKTLETNQVGKDKRPSSSSSDSEEEGEEELQAMVGEGIKFKEDAFLTSANLCRWVIDYNELALGKQLGMGSYGVVYHGKWKGVEVAVKRFVKQKLDERRMLEFRAEMAFLSELHHPNIILFIGACVKRPNLCIVTEYVKNGSLRDILHNQSIRLPLDQRVKLLHSAALGISYLHSLAPIIVHRDLKTSNLLVDDNMMTVKVADFGFARIKEENTTMTKCGTPCWTAPEVIRGEKYDEKIDIYSFGIIMWEALTRKQPFADRNFMGVSLDVLEGRRPAIPNNCPPEFAKLMKKCWNADPKKRPTMEDVVTELDLMCNHRGGEV